MIATWMGIIDLKNLMVYSGHENNRAGGNPAGPICDNSRIGILLLDKFLQHCYYIFISIISLAVPSRKNPKPIEHVV